jgi:hypothetical protein
MKFNVINENEVSWREISRSLSFVKISLYIISLRMLGDYNREEM